MEIACSMQLVPKDGSWLVPSQAGGGKYTVDYNQEAPRCSCPDYELRRKKCKHIFAVEYTIERERTTVTERTADGQTKTTVTERVKVTRKTYKQEWPAYNQAQTQEKAQFVYLLN
jgi:uncharacterized Zn finger protein